MRIVRFRVLAALFATALAALPAIALTCDCGHQGTIEYARDHAQTAVVIRIVEAKLDPNGFQAVYRFESIGALRGQLSSVVVRAGFRRCCGTRVDVGHHYLVLLRPGDAFTELHAGNAVPLGPEFGSLQWEWVDALLKGTRDFDDWRSYPGGWMHQVPPPPPPPPLCPAPTDAAATPASGEKKAA